MSLRTCLTNFAILSLILLFACGGEMTEEDRRSYLPPANGGKAELLIVMDSAKWRGTLGEAVRDVFMEPVPGLPQPEPIFSAKFVTASQFSKLLKTHRNVVIVTTFDSKSSETRFLMQGFSPETKAKIETDTSLFMHKNIEEFAIGQVIMHLFATTEAQMIAKLQANKLKLQESFDKRETKIVADRILHTTMESKLSRAVAEKHGVYIPLSMGFKMAKDTTDFCWVRSDMGDIDRSIIVAYRPYTSEKQFSTDSIIAWRNRIGKAHIYANSEAASFMQTENQVAVDAGAFSIDGKYAQKIRGLWVIKSPLFGGPFVSYTFVDEATARLYYVEGFMFAPASNKREPMRELSILLEAMTIGQKED